MPTTQQALLLLQLTHCLRPVLTYTLLCVGHLCAHSSISCCSLCCWWALLLWQPTPQHRSLAGMPWCWAGASTKVRCRHNWLHCMPVLGVPCPSIPQLMLPSAAALLFIYMCDCCTGTQDWQQVQQTQQQQYGGGQRPGPQQWQQQQQYDGNWQHSQQHSQQQQQPWQQAQPFGGAWPPAGGRQQGDVVDVFRQQPRT